jgi:hypothetical protein
MADTAAKPAIAKCGLARVMLVVFVCATAAMSLTWSHAKLMSQDEMYEFQTDSVRSLAELVHIQTTWPISLDPLLYHALSHAAMQAFGTRALAQRLPALAGFLLMQVCLFFFVRNLVGGSAGERAGAVAAAFPAVTATLFYAVEGRPYGLMLGLYALALWCWQVATRQSSVGSSQLSEKVKGRGWALLGLALAIAGTVNAHYFGILLLVPVCAAEAWRTLARRRIGLRIDWPMGAAIAVGMAGFLATRPFLEAAGEFRKNYYNGGSVGLHDITRAYRAIFVNYTQMPIGAQHAWMVALVVFAAALVWGCWRVRRTVESAEWVLVLALAALPFCGYLLARFVTHSIEVRYVLGAVVAISAMLALALSPWLKRDAVFNAALVLLGLGIVCGSAVRIHAEQQKTSARLASLVLPADARAALDANPDGRLYIQDMGAFEEDRYYEPDPDLQARMTLVYSQDEELRWNRHDTMALTAMHIEHFTGLPVISYQALRAQPGQHVFVLLHSGWDWTDQAFAQDGAQVTPLGKAMSGDVAAVRFR